MVMSAMLRHASGWLMSFGGGLGERGNYEPAGTVL